MEKYERADIEIVVFNTNDIIITSGGEGGSEGDDPFG